jgi:hypothetical protein
VTRLRPQNETSSVPFKFSALIDQRSRLMLSGYVTGRYPTPPDKQPWLRELIGGALRNYAGVALIFGRSASRISGGGDRDGT